MSAGFRREAVKLAGRRRGGLPAPGGADVVCPALQPGRLTASLGLQPAGDENLPPGIKSLGKPLKNL